jgi:hypothetical protein
MLDKLVPNPACTAIRRDPVPGSVSWIVPRSACKSDIAVRRACSSTGVSLMALACRTLLYGEGTPKSHVTLAPSWRHLGEAILGLPIMRWRIVRLGSAG